MKAKNPYVPKIRKVYIRFFYKSCMCCNLEFKNAHMWRYSYVDDWGADSHMTHRYLCEACAMRFGNTIDKIAEVMMDDWAYTEYKKASRKLLELKNG